MLEYMNYIIFMYKVNSIGPRIDPWGTPTVILLTPDLVLFIVINCFLSFR